MESHIEEVKQGKTLSSLGPLKITPPQPPQLVRSLYFVIRHMPYQALCCTINVERFAGLNIYGFYEVFAGILS